MDIFMAVMKAWVVFVTVACILVFGGAILFFIGMIIYNL